ncbi:SCO4225 family membrane protein [Streptomyces sp. NPDC018610]|uniref:SCO4225 family membrane protein n=1 Tax=Streptomyces sp. NPDC018610 TaxID=3365049 RepID=UPI0037B34498
MRGDTRSRSGGLLARLRAHWLSAVYLLVTAAVCVWVAVDWELVAHQDASFAAVWPLALTAPVSLLLLLVPGDSVFVYAACVVLGVGVNAWLLQRMEPGSRASER